MGKDPVEAQIAHAEAAINWWLDGAGGYPPPPQEFGVDEPLTDDDLRAFIEGFRIGVGPGPDRDRLAQLLEVLP